MIRRGLQSDAVLAWWRVARRRPADRAALSLLIGGAEQAAKRVRAVADESRSRAKQGLRARLLPEDPKDTPPQAGAGIAEADRGRARSSASSRLTLRVMLLQAGLETVAAQLLARSRSCSAHCWRLAVLVVGVPWYVALGAGLVGCLGLPRWFLGYLRKRRQQVFLNEFADAIDVMVRGLKAGLPVTDAMKVIAAETPAPVGPEFLDVVEGQRVGITIDQGIERMFERMPLAEVNFLGHRHGDPVARPAAISPRRSAICPRCCATARR